MEPFALIVWLWMGQRFEETRMEGLGRDECFELLLAIGGDRAHKKGRAECTAPSYKPPPHGYEQQCSYCGQLPGRRRL
jgi:hypothetical protein